MVNVTVPDPESVCVYLFESSFTSDSNPPDTFCHLILFTSAGDFIIAVKITSTPYFTLVDGVARVTEMEPVEIDQVSTLPINCQWDIQINKH